MTLPAPYPVGTKDARHVLLGVLAGDNHLEPEILGDLEEIRNGNAGPVAALLLVDVFGGARIVEISVTVDVKIQSLGVISTGDPQVLTTFFSRALRSYPKAEHVAVLLAGHGQGVLAEKEDEGAFALHKMLTTRPPAWKVRDEKPWKPPPPPSILDDDSGGLLSTHEVGMVLADARNIAVVPGKLEALYLDACLGAMVELLVEIAPHFDVFVASQHLEDAAGWNYKTLFELFNHTHPKDGRTWGKLAVDAFATEYGPIADEENPATLSAHKTIDSIVASFKQLVDALKPLGQAGFDQVLAVADQSQTFGRKDLVDLDDFAEQGSIAFAGTPPVAAACANIREALGAARVANVALGATVKRARGLSFYLPRSQDLYFFQKDTYPGLQFCQQTGWADYFVQYLPQQ